ncbi:hypothetical protein E2C01_081508 [Portunus trituberculatus]|uniref:Uncharacterized protein n=1 Tax=Portunus trituberculatus TaxID=210409 RepID=A0A5B7IS33_PORTR|nr:hypothetical protein [Portunus trituberculatus]
MMPLQAERQRQGDNVGWGERWPGLSLPLITVAVVQKGITASLGQDTTQASCVPDIRTTHSTLPLSPSLRACSGHPPRRPTAPSTHLLQAGWWGTLVGLGRGHKHTRMQAAHCYLRMPVLSDAFVFSLLAVSRLSGCREAGLYFLWGEELTISLWGDSGWHRII